MNETLLISKLRLFAFITILHSEVVYEHTRSFIEKLLRQELHLQNYEYYLHLFHKFHQEYVSKFHDLPDDGGHAGLKVICSSISSNLPIKERISIVVHLLQFIKYYQINHFYGFKKDYRLRDTIDFIASEFHIMTEEYQSLCEFIFENLHHIRDKKNLLIAGKVNIFPDIKFILRENLNQDNQKKIVDKYIGEITKN